MTRTGGSYVRREAGIKWHGGKHGRENATKKNILTYAGLKKLEDELYDLKVNQRKMISEKIKEAREQGELSENAEYDARRMSSAILKPGSRRSRKF